MIKFYIPTWDEIHQDLIELSEKIYRSGVKPDLIVAIARGGWVIGRILSDLLANRNVGNVRIEFYKNIGETIKKPLISQPISVDPKGKKILLCDDVSDSGNSLKAAYDHLREKESDIIKVVCLHKKPWSIFTPDYYIRETDKWIIYPWEYRETIDQLIAKLEKEGLSLKEAFIKIRELAKTNMLFKKIVDLIEKRDVKH